VLTDATLETNRGRPWTVKATGCSSAWSVWLTYCMVDSSIAIYVSLQTASKCSKHQDSFWRCSLQVTCCITNMFCQINLQQVSAVSVEDYQFQVAPSHHKPSKIDMLGSWGKTDFSIQRSSAITGLGDRRVFQAQHWRAESGDSNAGLPGFRVFRHKKPSFSETFYRCGIQS